MYNSIPTFRRANIICRQDVQFRSDRNVATKTVLVNKRESQEELTKQKWIVTEKNIPDLPFMHHLNFNHIVVTQICPSIIAKNIQESLRKLSITVRFDNHKVVAHAVTQRKLRFEIRMFGRRTKSNDQRELETIVEIQRMTSNQYGFDKIVKAIFSAANGEPFVVPDLNQTSNWINLSVNERQFSTSKSDEEKIGFEQLDRIGKMLNQKEFDINKIGMQSMISLTNKRHTSKIISNLAANSILYGNDYDFGGLRSKIYNLIVHGKTVKDNVNDMNECNSFLETHYFDMRGDALLVFLNLLEIATSSSLNIHDIISTIWFGDEFIQALFNIVRRSTIDPHSARDAYTIMKCLNLMISNSLLHCRLKSMITPLMQSTVEHSVLQDCHDLLASESKDFMLSLTNV